MYRLQRTPIHSQINSLPCPVQIHWFEAEGDGMGFRAAPNNCFDLWMLTDGAIRTTTAAENLPSFGLMGLNKTVSYLTFEQKVSGFHICLTPIQLRGFVRMPLAEITRQGLSLTDLWGQKGDDLQEQVKEAKTPTKQVQAVEEFFASLYRPAEAACIERIVREVELGAAGVTVSYLRKSVGLSERQFERLFHRHIGIAPRTYLKISRFQRAVALYKKYQKRVPSVSLLSIGLQAGYYDHAHFIHDCSTFTGLTPERYFLCMDSAVSGAYNTTG